MLGLVNMLKCSWLISHRKHFVILQVNFIYKRHYHKSQSVQQTTPSVLWPSNRIKKDSLKKTLESSGRPTEEGSLFRMDRQEVDVACTEYINNKKKIVVFYVQIENAHKNRWMETHLLWLLHKSDKNWRHVSVRRFRSERGSVDDEDEPADQKAGSRKLEQQHVKSWFERCLWWQTAVSSAVSFKWFLCQAEWRG